ncbi:MAG: glycosyltransferase [Candidatus Limnocylindria bacterium]
MRRWLFWTSAGVVAYTYVGFPVIVLLRGRLRRRPYLSDDSTPRVTIVVAARNERAAIGAKIANCRALDYPAESLEVVIASDGSEDGTDEIVRAQGGNGLLLLSLPRVGKAAALDAAVAASSGEVLVFSDANSMYATDALRELVRPFADPSIGGVAGNQRYRPDGVAAGAAEGERAYWNFDRTLKEAESQAGSTISATGAIYAIRRTLFRGVPVGVTDDFAVSTGVIAQGHRLVFAPRAIAWESVAESGWDEWDRKVRVITRGLRGVWVRRELLHPRHGFYAVQLLTHKLMRRVMGVPLIVMAAIAPTLWRYGWIYRISAVSQWAVMGLGTAGLLLSRSPIGRHRLLATPAFFLLVNAAALTAAWNVIRGRRIDRWDPARPRDRRSN